MINTFREIAKNITRNGVRPPQAPPSQEERHRQARQQVIHAVEARLNERRTPGERFADGIVTLFGTLTSAFIHGVIFVGWLAVNMGFFPDVPAFDPPPFILLTMFVSLEAIFLSIFVLISQNRESKISTLREEIDIHINMIAEQEITKVIHLISYLMKHLNVPLESDPELKNMLKPLDLGKIEEELERQLSRKVKT